MSIITSTKGVSAEANGYILEKKDSLTKDKKPTSQEITGGGLVNGEGLRVPSSELGQDAFLKILIAQLSNQDPTEPMKDTEFIAQMAQFSALEQMQALNATFKSSQAYNYVGKTVVATTHIQDENGKWVETQLTGVVSGIEFHNDKPYLVLGEYLIEMDSVNQVYDANLENSVVQGGSLIGKYVKANKVTSDGNVIQVMGQVTKVSFKDGGIFVEIDGKEEIPMANIDAISDKPISMDIVKPEEPKPDKPEKPEKPDGTVTPDKETGKVPDFAVKPEVQA